jgi:hypothetical protein
VIYFYKLGAKLGQSTKSNRKTEVQLLYDKVKELTKKVRISAFGYEEKLQIGMLTIHFILWCCTLLSSDVITKQYLLFCLYFLCAREILAVSLLKSEKCLPYLIGDKITKEGETTGSHAVQLTSKGKTLVIASQTVKNRR